MVEIPAHRLREPGGERLARAPAELLSDLRRIDRIAAVVPGPVGDEGDEAPVAAFARANLLQRVAQGMHDLEVAPLGIGPDVVGLAGPPARKREAERLAMVADVEPVSDLAS